MKWTLTTPSHQYAKILPIRLTFVDYDRKIGDVQEINNLKLVPTKIPNQIPQNPSTMGPISSQPRPLLELSPLSPQAPQARAIGLWAIGLWATSPPRVSDQDDRFMHENPNQNCCEFADVWREFIDGNYMKETVSLLFYLGPNKGSVDFIKKLPKDGHRIHTLHSMSLPALVQLNVRKAYASIA